MAHPRKLAVQPGSSRTAQPRINPKRPKNGARKKKRGSTPPV